MVSCVAMAICVLLAMLSAGMIIPHTFISLCIAFSYHLLSTSLYSAHYYYYSVGVHNTEYEVMSEDPTNTNTNTSNNNSSANASPSHTLIRASSHSSSFYHNTSNSNSNGNMSMSSPSFSNFNSVPVGVRASSAKHGTGALILIYLIFFQLLSASPLECVLPVNEVLLVVAFCF